MSTELQTAEVEEVSLDHEERSSRCFVCGEEVLLSGRMIGPTFLFNRGSCSCGTWRFTRLWVGFEFGQSKLTVEAKHPSGWLGSGPSVELAIARTSPILPKP